MSIPEGRASDPATASTKKHYIHILIASTIILVTILALQGALPTNAIAIAEFLGSLIALAIIPLIIMRLAGNVAGWATLLIVAGAFAYGMRSSTNNTPPPKTTITERMGGFAYQAKDCEFSVTFPEAPTRRTFTLPNLGDYEQALWTSKDPKSATMLRTECISVPTLAVTLRTNGPKRYLIELLVYLSKDSGLSGTTYEYFTSPLGHVAEARGTKHVKGVPVTYKIVVIAGKTSLMTLYAGGVAATFPQKEVTPFLESVQKS